MVIEVPEKPRTNKSYLRLNGNANQNNVSNYLVEKTDIGRTPEEAVINTVHFSKLLPEFGKESMAENWSSGADNDAIDYNNFQIINNLLSEEMPNIHYSRSLINRLKYY